MYSLYDTMRRDSMNWDSIYITSGGTLEELKAGSDAAIRALDDFEDVAQQQLKTAVQEVSDLSIGQCLLCSLFCISRMTSSQVQISPVSCQVSLESGSDLVKHERGKFLEASADER